MPVLAIFTGAGIKKENYETLRKEIGWEKTQPDGAIFHVAVFDERGDTRVADVWESPEKLNAFVEKRLQPAMQKHNLPSPKVEVYPTHNINAFPTIARYTLK